MRVPHKRGGIRTYFLLLGLIAVVAGYASEASILRGMPLLLLGVVLHTWAKGCLRQNRTVTRSGPYRFVRHPFYAANALIDGGIVVMSGCWPLMLIAPIWWLAVYVPVMRSEDRYLASAFPDLHQDYQKRIPALIPWRRPLPKTGDGFTWRNPNIADGRELTRSANIIAFPLLFAFLLYFRVDGWAVFHGTHPIFWILVAGLVTLWGLAWEYEHSLKHKRHLLPSILARPGARMAVMLVTLVLALAIPAQEVEIDWFTNTFGLLLLAVSAVAYVRWDQWIWAEGLAVAGACVLCELFWLAAIPLLFYSALELDTRLRPTPLAAPTPVGRPFRFSFYHVVVLAGISAAILKELIFG